MEWNYLPPKPPKQKRQNIASLLDHLGCRFPKAVSRLHFDTQQEMNVHSLT